VNKTVNYQSRIAPMKQLSKSFFHLLPHFLSERNLLIFLTHFKLFFASFIHHRFKKDEPEEEKKTNIMGYKISFYNYPILINQFEEIFIYKSYRFKSSAEAPLIFDCGSNIGISILYFKIFHAGSRIVAFEPDPDNFRLLKKNIEQNRFSNITLHHCALGQQDGLTKLFYASKGSLNSSIYAKESGAGSINVAMKRLSLFIHEEINFMKMDVEGAEGEIVQELSEAGKLKSINELVIEFHLKSVMSEDKLILTLKNAGLGLAGQEQFYGQEKLLRFKSK
jgi:FkbM family methyltransferase